MRNRKIKKSGIFKNRILEEIAGKIFPRSGRENQSGYTMVEIAVVVFLILIAIVPAARVISSSLEASNDDLRLTHSTLLAQMKIEEIRARASCYSSRLTGGCPEADEDITKEDSDFEIDFSQTAAACILPAAFNQYKCTVDTDWRYQSTGPPDSFRDPAQGDPGVGWGGIKVIQVRVWFDKNGDNLFDSDEPDVFLETQLAQRAPDWGYQ